MFLFLGIRFSDAANLTVDSSFENGNGVAQAIDQSTRAITLNLKTRNGAIKIWWHFKISGITPGEAITIDIPDFEHKSFKFEPVYSYDHKTWHRMDDKTHPYTQVFTKETVWIAPNIPYDYSKSVELSTELEQLPHVSVEDLCLSEENRAVKLLRISDPAVIDKNKKIFWIQARLHAFESHSSWVAEGAARWISGDSTEAKRLREKAIVYIAPIMDVDSVFGGWPGKQQTPDFNRNWVESPSLNVVSATIAKLDAEAKKNTLMVFIDIHDPWYSVKGFFDRPAGGDMESVDSFFDQIVESIPEDNENSLVPLTLGPFSKIRGTAFGYAQENWGSAEEETVSLVWEVAHTKDSDGNFMTSKGLYGFGEALGRACLLKLEKPLIKLQDVPEGLPEISADEPMVVKYSAKKAAEYLDRSALNWVKTKNCVTCHTTLFYMVARPALHTILPDSGEVRSSYEDYRKVRWQKKGPSEAAGFWPIVVGTGLAFNDAQTTGRLSDVARDVLDMMWTVQREDGGWNWSHCDYAPMEIDDHYGVTVAALTIGIAPDDYAKTPQSVAGLDKMRTYFNNNPPLSLHHRAMLAWISVRINGIATEQQRQDTLAELLALQRDDGGWSTAGFLTDWKGLAGDDGEPLKTKASDGYGTGLVIVIARELGVPANDPRLQKGIQWIHANQRESGKWFTESPVCDAGNLISNAGSAFVVLALQACGELPGWPFSSTKPDRQ